MGTLDESLSTIAADPRQTDTVARYLLPHPLAALYQLVYVHSRPGLRYANLLRLSEGLTRFLAYLALADAASCGAGPRRMGDWLKLLRTPGFGKLQGLLRSANSFLADQPDRFLPELEQLSSDVWEAAIGRTIDARNHYAHRSFAVPDAAARGAPLDELTGDVRVLLAHAQFLRHYRLGTSHNPRSAGAGWFVNHWRGSRGQEEECAATSLRGRALLPEEAALLLDPREDRALVLSPFFHRSLDRKRSVFLWLDHLGANEAVYRHPVLELEVSRALPDPFAPDEPGVSSEAYIARVDSWHDRIGLELDDASRRALTGSGSPTTFDEQFTVVGKLGEGAMGTVWEVQNNALDRRAALKILKKEHLPSETQIKRFTREAKLLSKLQHPGIVDVYSMGVAPSGEPFLEMELLDGEPLHRRLERTGPMSAWETRDLAVAVLSALAYIHEQGVIHRDLKPSNIILCDAGPRLVDFGIAAVIDGTQLTSTMSAMGTLNYMAPEQWGGKADARSDLYGLGRVLYQCVTGEAPEGLETDLTGRDGVDPGLAGVVLRATQSKPTDRYGSAAAMKAALDGVEEAEPGPEPEPEPEPEPSRVEAPKPSPPPPVAEAAPGRLGVVMVATAALIAAIAAGAWLMLPPRFAGLTLVDVDPRRTTLRLDGQRLDRDLEAWSAPWLRELSGLGLAASAVNVAADGRSADATVTVAPGFDATELPLPGGGTAPLRYHFALRIHYTHYKDQQATATKATFQRLLDEIRRSEALERLNVTFEAEPVLSWRKSNDYDDSSAHFLSSEIEEADLLDTSTFLSISFKWRHMAAAPGPWGGRDAPFEWLACNLGPNLETHYTSLLIAPAETPLARALGPDEELTPQRLRRFLASRPGQRIDWWYNTAGSTSGYVIPCLTWSPVLSALGDRVSVDHSDDHGDTVRLVLEQPSEHPPVGAVYDLMLEQKTEDPAWGGAEHRVLWRSGEIPHGGILVRNDILPRKRDAIERALSELWVRDEATPIEWPDRGDVKGLRNCDKRRFERLEDSILDHPQASVCVEELSELRPR